MVFSGALNQTWSGSVTMTVATVLLSAAIDAGGGELTLRARSTEGVWEERITVAPHSAGGGNRAVAALFGREAVEDAEMRLAAGAPASEIDALVERLGLEYQIATRLTSWLAVARDIGVDPTKPTRRDNVPQMLPFGLSVEGLGLRAPEPLANAFGQLPVRIETWRGMSVEPAGNSWQQIAPIEGCSTVGSGR